MSRIVIIFILFLTLFANSAVAEEVEAVSHVRLKPMTKAQFYEIREMGLDMKVLPGDQIEVFAKPNDFDRLRGAGVEWDVLIPNMQKFFELRNTDMVDFGGFRTFSQIVDYLDSLKTAFPSIITDKYSIGTSLNGEQQWVVKISDNPDVDEDEPEVLYISLIHSREPAGAAALLHFMEYMLTNYGVDPAITDLIDNRELYFLPVQNPDGYLWNEQIAPFGGGLWRKNRRNNGDGEFGVDLNRNYSYMWGFDDIGSSPYTWSETYRGPEGFSEPETQNVRDFIVSRDFTIIHNFHTYSNLEIWAPSYTRIFGYEEDFFSNLGDSMTQYNNYDPGIGWTLYPTNGDADDWAWGDTLSKPQIISLTVEIGSASDYFWPMPARIPVLCEENIFPNLYLAQIADNPYAIAPPNTPTISCSEVVPSDFRLDFEVDDDINPAASYRLMEYTGKQQVTDDAEVDAGYWDVTDLHLSVDRFHSGATSWHTQGSSRGHHWLLSATPYEVKENDWLRFWVWYELDEHADYFYAQISNDGGCEFVNLPCTWTTNDNPYNLNLGNGMTGISGGWVEAEFDLSDYEGEQVQFRLALFCDDYTLLEGIYIDDIENVDMFQTSTEISSTISNDYYDFSSKPDGDYWYRVAAFDAEGQESRLSPYVHTEVASVVCCVFNGDCDHDGEFNIADVDYYINWWLSHQDPLVCDEEGDVNGDRLLDILDLDHMIAYLFSSGPPPVPCHALN